jgi:hypothetical protein
MSIISTERTDSLNTWRTNLNSICTNVGDLATLATSTKNSIVAAINDTGSITNLITTNKTNIVAAINEVESSINALGTMSTQAANSVNISGGSLAGIAITGVTNLTVATNITPTSDDTRDIGTTGAQFKDLYIDGVTYTDALSSYNNSSITIITGKHLIPAADISNDIGDITHRLRYLYADKISLTATDGSGFSTSIIPITDDNLSLGSSTREWQNLYIDGTAYIDTLSNGGSDDILLGQSLIPVADTTQSLGTALKRYNNIYGVNLYGNKSIATKYVETQATPTISGGNLTLDLSSAQTFIVTLNANITTLTISNTPSNSSQTYGFILNLIGDGTARTVSWGVDKKWLNATTPTLSATNGAYNIISFITYDGGTTWYGIPGGLGVR